MTLATRWRWTCLLAAASLLLCACQGTEWSNVKVASPYRAPAHGVNVSVSIETKGTEWAEVVDAFTTALVDELKESGIKATVDVDAPTSDELQLTIVEWEPGSQALRYFVGFGAGEERIVVIVDVSKPDGKKVFHGRLRSYVAGGLFGGSSNTSLREAARCIADAVNSGQVD